MSKHTDLLEACQKAIALLDIATQDGLNRNWDIYVILRDAIAKATKGETE